jgi:hypothetical protein
MHSSSLNFFPLAAPFVLDSVRLAGLLLVLIEVGIFSYAYANIGGHPRQLSPPPTQSPPQYWYYCASVKVYYPYLAHCPDGWKQAVPQPTPPGQ